MCGAAVVSMADPLHAYSFRDMTSIPHLLTQTHNGLNGPVINTDYNNAVYFVRHLGLIDQPQPRLALRSIPDSVRSSLLFGLLRWHVCLIRQAFPTSPLTALSAVIGEEYSMMRTMVLGTPMVDIFASVHCEYFYRAL